MKEEEKVKMKLDIAGERFFLSVPYSRQEDTRRTEEELNMLYRTWRSRFPEKSDKEVLAMIAFRYADRYSDLLRSQEDIVADSEIIGRELDRLISGNSQERVNT